MMLLLILALFVVSGDIFFVFHVEGFTVRIFQLCIIPVIFVGTLRLLRDPRSKQWPIGIKPLMVWALFMLVFIPNTTFVPRSVGYVAWLFLDILLVIGLTGVLNSDGKLLKLLRWYVYSFAFCAVFGLVQLFTPLVGLPGIFVQQWWFPGMLPRINGFSYEPSYYATYMLTGWVFIDYLRYRNVFLVRRMNLIFWLTTAAILLSSSRLGWSIMIVWVAIRVSWHIRELGIVIPWKSIAPATLIVALLIAGVMSHYHLDTEDLSFLGTGLGLFGSIETHSTDTRLGTAMETLDVFFHHPIIGVSLGGVATALGGNRNSSITDQDSTKENEGVCVTAEVLAASGIFGFIPFVFYMYGLMWTPIHLTDTSDLGVCVKSLTWSLIMVFLALQFSPTILRAPFWLHIAILSASYRVFRSTQRRRKIVAALRQLEGPTPAMG
jgi:hypothetical protein